uniref:Uncharacterized protein n=1 Tax=Chromera velia CCMP2878 TaxID=1169474 RepID=A0A0G4HSW1_9ALVE|eukprot:Cvel_8352.t1-p1 / transcript=Cvel_8352.t1 / gene=Cvel_8352 / organism=Chromera_velia_CCMP2878 / gene_product=hypothetical protein / transcript_product=hypothetical protein / location=Cvel_scaffold460:6581-7974(+) / protein_length=415 / sequence_SO=supercontig / SO=protein_coding / is_pseudo=false
MRRLLGSLREDEEEEGKRRERTKETRGKGRGNMRVKGRRKRNIISFLYKRSLRRGRDASTTPLLPLPTEEEEGKMRKRNDPTPLPLPTEEEERKMRKRDEPTPLPLPTEEEEGKMRKRDDPTPLPLPKEEEEAKIRKRNDPTPLPLPTEEEEGKEEPEDDQAPPCGPQEAERLRDKWSVSDSCRFPPRLSAFEALLPPLLACTLEATLTDDTSDFSLPTFLKNAVQNWGKGEEKDLYTRAFQAVWDDHLASSAIKEALRAIDWIDDSQKTFRVQYLESVFSEAAEGRIPPNHGKLILARDKLSDPDFISEVFSDVTKLLPLKLLRSLFEALNLHLVKKAPVALLLHPKAPRFNGIVRDGDGHRRARAVREWARTEEVLRGSFQHGKSVDTLRWLLFEEDIRRDQIEICVGREVHD